MPQQGTASATQFSPRATVNVRLADNANLETIQKIVATIGGRFGCQTCGLAGVDLRLSGDPVELREFSQLSGVKHVSME